MWDSTQFCSLARVECVRAQSSHCASAQSGAAYNWYMIRIRHAAAAAASMGRITKRSIASHQP